MKRNSIVCGLLVNGLLAFGQPSQNLVENGGFEETKGKIKQSGAIEVAVGWSSSTQAAADLFSEKVKKGFGTPVNTFGRENPFEGKNYAGIRTYAYNNKEPRSYLSTSLKTPLKKGKTYCVVFHLSLAEGSKYAANNVGVHLSKKQYHIKENRNLTLPTHVIHGDNPLFNAYFGWDEVCAVYTAEGGEVFLTIGNFFTNEETKSQKLKKPKGFAGTSVLSSYYYIDGVSLKEVADEMKCGCKSKKREKEANMDYVYEVGSINPEGVKDEMVIRHTELYFKFGQAEFTQSNRDHLANIVTVMLRNEALQLVVYGHMDTDEARDGQFLEVDRQRAEAVKKHLIEKGVLAERITTVVKGAEEPQSTSGDQMGKAKNRRVVFQLR